MPSREVVAQGLLELRGLFPALPDDAVFLRGLVDDLDGYDDDEFALAVRRIRSTRKRMQGAPTNADFGEACASIAAVRRASAVRQRREDKGSTAYCPLCGTTELAWSEAWPNGQSRMVPRHQRLGDAPCPRAYAEHAASAPVNMAAWPGRRAAREVVEVKPSRGLAALANIITQHEEQAQ